MRRYKVVDGAEALHDLDFVYHVGPGRYCISNTNLIIFVDGIKADGSSIIRFFFSHRHPNWRCDLTFEQFFNKLPEEVKEDVLYNLDIFQ